MDLVVAHPSFKSQKLSVRTAGFFSGPKVLLNGVAVKRIQGKYTVKNDIGQEVAVELKSNFVDPVPSVKIGPETINLAKRLTWHEYAWSGLPIVLLFIGGALGAVIGMLAAFSNTRILRSDRGSIARYSLTGAVSVAAFVAFLVLATGLHMLINGMPR